MRNITSVDELKNAIQFLEAEQIAKGQLLKEQAILIYESLKPINFFRNTLRDIFSIPDMTENISGNTIGAASFLIDKLFVGKSGNIFRKIIGSLLQFGLSNVITRNSDFIRSFGQVIIQQLFRKKKDESQKA